MSKKNGKAAPNVYIAVPMRDERVATGLACALMNAHGHANLHVEFSGFSILPHNFNMLWMKAVNHNRGTGKLPNIGHIDYFIMCHDDIAPFDGDGSFVKRLIEEIEECGADVLSVVVPIKNMSGMTSTAIDTDHWNPRRLTQKEISQLPKTFDETDIEKVLPGPHGDLLVNTGLFIVKFDKWVEHIQFRFQTGVGVFEKTGQLVPLTVPEDWDFSRQCRALGVKVKATSKQVVVHMGGAGYKSDNIWGQDTDTQAIDLATKVTDIRSVPDRFDAVEV